jgi:hypothetical protein
MTPEAPMSKPAKCPLCGGEVVEGILIDYSHVSYSEGAKWVDGEPEQGWLSGLKLKGKLLRTVRGLRCKKCGYLLLFAH